jgi:hypothetical protein
MPLAPMKKEDAPNADLEEAWEYYHTPRAQYPTTPGWATARSLNQIVRCDAYNMAEVNLNTRSANPGSDRTNTQRGG